MFEIAFLAAFAAATAYYNRKLAEYEKWEDDMVAVAAPLHCDDHVPGLAKKMLDLRVRAEHLLGETLEEFESRKQYVH